MLDADFEVARRDFSVSAQMHLEPGQRLSLLGASGAGKTTILAALAGFLPLERGEIRLGGRLLSRRAGPTLPPRLRRVGLVGQGSTLFPHLTVLQNICYAPGVDPGAARQRAANLGLAKMLDTRPAALSEGERRRVSLARALTAGCELLCLDEPFSALDRPLAEDLLQAVVAEVAQLGVAAILVTHDLEEAQAFSGPIMILDQGRILQYGESREVLRRPATTQVARLLGYRGSLVQGSRRLVVHPELVGPAAVGGIKVAGEVTGCRPAGGQFTLELLSRGPWSGWIRARWPVPVPVGSSLEVAVPSAPQYDVKDPWESWR